MPVETGNATFHERRFSFPNESFAVQAGGRVFASASEEENGPLILIMYDPTAEQWQETNIKTMFDRGYPPRMVSVPRMKHLCRA